MSTDQIAINSDDRIDKITRRMQRSFDYHYNCTRDCHELGTCPVTSVKCELMTRFTCIYKLSRYRLLDKVIY